MHSDVGIGSDDLLLRRQLGALLELEVTNGPRQGQVAVDTAKVNETTSSADTGFLACFYLVMSASSKLVGNRDAGYVYLRSEACGQMTEALRDP